MSSVKEASPKSRYWADLGKIMRWADQETKNPEASSRCMISILWKTILISPSVLLDRSTMSSNDTFQTPLNSRYASTEMKQLWSPRTRFSTWRKLWLWLAQSEKELGLAISDEAIQQLEKHVIIQDDEFAGVAEEYDHSSLMNEVMC
jgi:hypothetical protein